MYLKPRCEVNVSLIKVYITITNYTYPNQLGNIHLIGSLLNWNVAIQWRVLFHNEFSLLSYTDVVNLSVCLLIQIGDMVWGLFSFLES